MMNQLSKEQIVIMQLQIVFMAHHQMVFAQKKQKQILFQHMQKTN